MKTMLFNPFVKYSEKQLLIAGILITVLGGLLGYYCSARFDGVLDMHISSTTTIVTAFTDNVINIISLFIPLYLLARYINTKTRAIDILCTILIARLPVYLATLSNVTGFMLEIEKKIDINNPLNINLEPLELVILMVTGILSLAFLVWHVALLYSGFKVSCNAKTVKHNVLFAVAILVAEVLSKITLSIIN